MENLPCLLAAEPLHPGDNVTWGMNPGGRPGTVTGNAADPGYVTVLFENGATVDLHWKWLRKVA